MIAALPVAAWELSLGVWLVVKGFKPSPLTSTDVPGTIGNVESNLAPAVA
ncbi:MAG TPA: hypothetical protein VHF27_13495 [Acidimicrobiales bacterium]|nr:hypothetical protein [Acidimicrobiales bacterium]